MRWQFHLYRVWHQGLLQLPGAPQTGKLQQDYGQDWRCDGACQKAGLNLDFYSNACYNIAVEIRSSTQAGRRGVTRNLVGRESVARVRIPSPPPEKNGNRDTITVLFN